MGKVPNKPLAFLYCKSCGDSVFELYVSSKSLGAVCLECQKLVFDIVDLSKFVKTSLFSVNKEDQPDKFVN